MQAKLDTFFRADGILMLVLRLPSGGNYVTEMPCTFARLMAVDYYHSGIVKTEFLLYSGAIEHISVDFNMVIRQLGLEPDEVLKDIDNAVMGKRETVDDIIKRIYSRPKEFQFKADEVMYPILDET